MGFGSLAIDEANYERGRGRGIAKLLEILKEHPLEELLTCEDPRLRLIAEFFVEKEKEDCETNRLSELITQFEETWKTISEDPFSAFNDTSRRSPFGPSNRPMPTL